MGTIVPTVLKPALNYHRLTLPLVFPARVALVFWLSSFFCHLSALNYNRIIQRES